ncbi:MAG: hypothetical protein M5R36_25390 [Deltaproteobacteria bacterium]|nr:hypothetical protein [Deltaproteobacteria bacterium]
MPAIGSATALSDGMSSGSGKVSDESVTQYSACAPAFVIDATRSPRFR